MQGVKDYLGFANTSEVRKLLDPDEKVVFAGTLYKFNPMGWKQARNIVITNKSIMNLKKKSLQRKIKLTAVEAVSKSLAADSKEFVLHIPSEYDYRYTGDLREEIIQVLKEVHLQTHSKNLPVYGVPASTMKEFVTSKADRKKGILKIPDESFRLAAEDLVIETQAKNVTIEEELPDLNSIKAKVLYSYTKSGDEISLSKFKHVRQLFRTTYERNYLIEHLETKTLYSLKELKKDTILNTDAVTTKKIEEEVAKSNHPFLIRPLYVLQAPGALYLIFKFMKGGSLHNLLNTYKRFTERKAQIYAAQIAQALTFLHKQDILDRNLRPETVLIDEDGYIGLNQFGIYRFIEDEKKRQQITSLNQEYRPPENFTGELTTKGSDWWSLGIILYEMLCGIPPFFSQNQHVLLQQISSKAVTFPDPIKYHMIISDNARDLISRLLVKNQKDRIGAGPAGGEDVLNHSFISSGLDSKLLLERKFTDDYFASPNDCSVDSMSEITIDEPATTLFNGISRSDFQKKLEAEFGGAQPFTITIRK